ncbi:MAG: M28 family metallopeptidase [Oceanicaulis sp.]|nr:M28 family metallopeptidase [Oceanicaulis sp.]
MLRYVGVAGASLIWLAACGEPAAERVTDASDMSESEVTVETVGTEPEAAPDGEWPFHQDTSPEMTEADFAYRISTLADDRFMGRAPGHEIGETAADWIAEEMRRMGLEPAGEDGGWFQNVPLIESTLDEAVSDLDITMNGEPMGLRMGQDVVFWTQQPVDSVAIDPSDMVFVGYGVVAPEFGWNDYAGLDVTGKTVVILVNDPGYARPDSGLFNGSAMTYYGRWTYKYEEAARQGAAGAIIVHQTEPASYGWATVRNSWSGPQFILASAADEPFVDVEGWIQLEIAEQLFEAAGLNFAELAEAAAEPGFTPVLLDGAQMTASLQNDLRTLSSRNVAGRVRGSERPDEHVLFMAHWDHLGERLNFASDDNIYNGAVDNASGTAFILELAEAFAAEEAPARSLIFVAVTAEEQGLLGSDYYAQNPLVPLNQTVGGFNFDAILPVGETENVVVIGYGASQMEDMLREEAEARGRYLSPDPTPEAGFFYRSDHVSMARRGVPMLYAKGGNVHVEFGEAHGAAIANAYRTRDYHQPSDEFDDSWDLAGFVQDGELFYALSRRLAESDEWPNWYEGNEFRGLRDAMME